MQQQEDSDMAQPSAQVRPIRETTTAPTETTASRDAIGAIVDSLLAATKRETDATRLILDQIDETALHHGARIKTELHTFLETIETINTDSAQRNRGLDRLRAEHARLINARVTD